MAGEESGAALGMVALISVSASVLDRQLLLLATTWFAVLTSLMGDRRLF
jgi:hypothetical protein